MQGFPKVIQTRHDVEVLLLTHPIEIKAFLSELCNDILQWYPSGELIGVEGITDDTHKVVTEEREGVEYKTQYELKENPDCKLYQMGYTIEEVNVIINDNQ
jgi:hypothetical protein